MGFLTSGKVSSAEVQCVSVVIPFYNANRFINDAIASVQRNSNYVREILLVVDRGSDPPKLESQYSNDVTIIYNDSEKGGAGYVRWLGVQRASGEFIAFLDSDDIWSSDKLHKQIGCMKENDIDFSFMAFRHFRTCDALGVPLPGGFAQQIPNGPFTLERFFKKDFVVPCLTVVISSRCLDGIHPNVLKRRNDYFMWYGLIEYIERNDMRWSGMKELGGYHRIHEEGLTSSRVKSAFHQYIFYKRCRLSLIDRMRYMIFYLVNTIGSR